MYSNIRPKFFVFLLAIACLGSAQAKVLVPADTTPKITVSTTVLQFGNVRFGQTASLSFTLKNTSDTLVKLKGAVDTTLKPPFTINGGAGLFNLDSGQFITVHVEFTPIQTGSVTDSLVITSNSGSPKNRIVIYLSGYGYIPDTIVKIGVTPSTLNFGVVYTGQSKSLQFVVKNTTNTRLRLTGNISNAHPPFAVTVGLGNFQLDSGQSLPVTVAFAPSVVGIYNDSIIINSNTADGSKRIVLHLVANVHSSDELLPAIDVSADTLNFGQMTKNTGFNPSLFVTIKNVSDSERLLIVNLLFPHDPFQTIGTQDHLTLNQRESQEVQVQFTPKAIGTFFDSLVVISNAPKSRIAVYMKAKVISTIDGVDQNEQTGLTLIGTYPNPTTNLMLLQIHSDVIATFSCTVSDLTGKNVLTTPVSILNAGNNILPLNLTSLPQGFYQGRIEGLGKPMLFKIVVTR